jgi:hypothetical protein
MAIRSLSKSKAATAAINAVLSAGRSESKFVQEVYAHDRNGDEAIGEFLEDRALLVVSR